MVQLDLLRGIAILLVLFRHSPVPWSAAGPLKPITLVLWRLGWTGVDLFFVLSGFLIGGLLFREIRLTGRLDVRRFLVRRGFKIWPAYFVYIAAVFLILSYAGGWQSALRDVAPNLLHAQNYLGTPRGQTWSLAVEEHFYLALPLFLLALMAIGRRGKAAIVGIPLTAAVLVVGCTVLRILSNGRRPFEMFTDQTATHLRIDGLFFGVLLAYFHHMKPHVLAAVAKHRSLLVVVAGVMIAPMALHDLPERAYLWTVGFTMLYVGYGALLILLVYSEPGKGLTGNLIGIAPARWIARIGVFSYSIYLWQFDLAVHPMERWVLPQLPHYPLSLYWAVATMLYLGLAVGTGVLAALIVEIPLLAIRDRLFPPPVRGMSVTPHASRLTPRPRAGSAAA